MTVNARLVSALFIIIVLVAVSYLFAGGPSPLEDLFKPAELKTTWRPSGCVQADFIKKSFDDSSNAEACAVGSAIFVAGNLSRNFYGQLFRRSYSDVYLDGVNYSTSERLITNVRLSFEYYLPFYEDSKECPVDPNNVNSVTGIHNNRQFVLIGNNQADFSSNVTFNAAYYDFTAETRCGSWLVFDRPIRDFSTSTEDNFQPASSSIDAIGFEVSNIYIRNITIAGPESKQVL